MPAAENNDLHIPLSSLSRNDAEQFLKTQFKKVNIELFPEEYGQRLVIDDILKFHGKTYLTVLNICFNWAESKSKMMIMFTPPKLSSYYIKQLKDEFFSNQKKLKKIA
jgi:hypothetical protein